MSSLSSDTKKRIIASGTFDHLHDGHKLFLSTAFSYGHVMIGLTAQEMLSGKKHPERLQGYATRRKNLTDWLSGQGHIEGKDYEVIEIDKVHGFACEIEDLDLILVTEDNMAVAESINCERESKGLRPLGIILCELLCDENGTISSTRERES